MITATWNGHVIAESDRTILVEGNHYFPVTDVRAECLAASETTSVCGWKGTASYHNVVVDGQTNRDAAWYYPTPKDAAAPIAGYIAFWKGVVVSGDGGTPLDAAGTCAV